MQCQVQKYILFAHYRNVPSVGFQLWPDVDIVHHYLRIKDLNTECNLLFSTKMINVRILISCFTVMAT